jgi:WD40 repeat protein
MNSLINENLLNLIFTAYTLKEIKTYLDKIYNKILSPQILKIINYESLFKSKRKHLILSKSSYAISKLYMLRDNNILEYSYNSIHFKDMKNYHYTFKITEEAISATVLPNGQLVTITHSGHIQFWHNHYKSIKNTITLENCVGYRKKIFSLTKDNLACFAYKDKGDKGDKLLIINCQKNKIVKILSLQIGIINSTVKLPNDMFATASDNGIITIWNMKKYNCLACYPCEENQRFEINALLSVEKRNLLISGSKSLKVWDICSSPPRCVHRIVDVGSVLSLMLLPGGYFASGDNIGEIKIWNLSNFHCINQFVQCGGVGSIVMLKDYRIVSCSGVEINVWDY